MRDDFPRAVVETLAKRVGNRCSNPACRKWTSGPHTQADKSVNVGVAAHVTAASPGGPRYNPSLTPEQRKDIGNGIWLCQSCAKLVDTDETRYTEPVLARWKLYAEREALKQVESAPGRIGSSDAEALKEYAAHFDRAALHDALRYCGSYKKFAEALGDLIGLLNTGSVQGRAVTKRRADFDNPGWRLALEALYHEVRKLRALYTGLVRSGEIDEGKCTCGFRSHSTSGEFEARKQAVIDRLNAVLTDAGLSTIGGVSGRANEAGHP